MSTSISITGSTYTVSGTVNNRTTTFGIRGLTVEVYDKDKIGKDDFLDSTTTNALGRFVATFDCSAFGIMFFDRKPDLYFIVKHGDEVLLDSSDDPIKNAEESSDPITLWVNDFDSNRPGAGKVPALGWEGGFVDTNDAFKYPEPNLTSLDMLKNRANIDKLTRQQKVLWPEFSWKTIPDEEGEGSRCYQMFAPDISRLGYTDDGRVYSIICPQQGACSPTIGCMNVEVTVTGNRGWVDESNKTLAADMTVEGRVWFSPGAKQGPIVKRLWDKFAESKLPFPSDKENAIIIQTFKPNFPDQPIFPLRKGESTDFPIPEFARHEEDAWDVAHLGVQIGSIKQTVSDIVNDFNQLIMDIFNTASGNMLAENNVLSWNVWFIAPQKVRRVEWATHTEKWRKSIDADHGSPMGEGTSAKYFDETPFKPLKSLIDQEEEKILAFEAKHFSGM